MKVITLLAAAALFCSISAASAQTETDEGLCQNIGGIAEAIMMRRQELVSMSQVMRDLPDTQHKAALEEIVVLAYDLPRFRAAGEQQQAAASFREAVERSCQEDRDKIAEAP